jgi:peptidoglycan-associated lipoprotein
MEDKTPDPFSEDIETANQAAYEQGLLGDVYFDFDKYDLTSDARERLAKNTEFMKAHAEFTYSLEGYCDERGTNDYNLALGDRRANAGKNYLLSLGIPSAPMRTISYGEERPQCNESHEGCWWRNRRVHFLITGRSDG